MGFIGIRWCWSPAQPDTGKTLTATQFLAALGEHKRSVLFAFEESRDQLYPNALGWRVDFPKWEQSGRLHILSEYPEISALEHHLLRIKKQIERFRPTRVAVDSLSALERISTPRTFREFVLALTSYALASRWHHHHRSP